MHKKIFFFITIFSIASCITYREIEFIDVHSISFSKENGCSPICADLKVYNPNRYSISIKDLDVEARLNEKKNWKCGQHRESQIIKTGLNGYPFNLSI